VFSSTRLSGGQLFFLLFSSLLLSGEEQLNNRSFTSWDWLVESINQQLTLSLFNEKGPKLAFKKGPELVEQLNRSSKMDLDWLANAIHQSEDGLTAGGTSGFYFDMDYLATTAEDIKKLYRWIRDTVGKFRSEVPIDLLAFVEKDSGPVGAITLLGLLAVELNLPAIIKTRKRFQQNVGSMERSLSNKRH
jgi:hypothetical protein